MKIDDIIQQRGLSEVLHFTKNAGLTGVLFKKSLRSRHRLVRDNELKYTFTPTAKYRKDQNYLDYVNLSLSEINSEFYNVAAKKWFQGDDLWWCILAFSPEILTHPGVIFATTNNMYTGVSRHTGSQGLESLFAKRIVRWSGNVIARSDGLQAHLPTCEQAEVLYPGEIGTEYLTRIYVGRPEEEDEAKAYLATFQCDDLSVVIDQDKFKGRKRFAE